LGVVPVGPIDDCFWPTLAAECGADDAIEAVVKVLPSGALLPSFVADISGGMRPERFVGEATSPLLFGEANIGPKLCLRLEYEDGVDTDLCGYR
jgi:hypothetical protein